MQRTARISCRARCKALVACKSLVRARSASFVGSAWGRAAALGSLFVLVTWERASQASAQQQSGIWVYDDCCTQLSGAAISKRVPRDHSNPPQACAVSATWLPPRYRSSRCKAREAQDAIGSYAASGMGAGPAASRHDEPRAFRGQASVSRNRLPQAWRSTA